MKNHRGIAALCVLTLVLQPLLSACSPKKPDMAFQEQLKQTNANHIAEGKKLPQSLITGYEEPLPEKEIGFTEKELESLTDYKKAAKPSDSKLISPAQAKTDTELFFRVLKYCYGPYQYFGGDEKFGKAKAAALSEIPAGNISTRRFGNILIQNLRFVEDVHFAIGDRNFADYSVYLHSEAVEYGKDANGYYKVNGWQKSYVKTVDGKDPAGFMRLSINPSGKLVYYVGGLYWTKKLWAQKKLPSVTVDYRSDSKPDTLKFSESVPSNIKQREGYKKSELGGVPVVSIRRFFDNNANDTACEDFAASGTALKGQKTLILDLRGNCGGSDGYITNWIRNFTGNWPGESAIAYNQITLQSRAEEYLASKTSLNAAKVTEDNRKAAESAMRNYQNGINQWIQGGGSPSDLRDNNSLIFVLMDNGDASSGESAITYLSSLKNVVLIGTNTAGCMIGNENIQFVLPKSGLVVACANWLINFNPDVFNEGVGLMPDIWDASGNTDRLLAMLRYYHLTDSAK